MKQKVMIGVLVVVSALAGASYVVIRRGFSAREEPSMIEAFVAKRVRRMSMPSAARDLKNPVANSPAALAAGMAHFADHCAICHGNDGRGKTLFGKGLYPKPPDMSAADTQNLTDGELYYVIENGIRLTGMPAFGEAEVGSGQDEESWHLVTFIRHLPQITDDELVQMKGMNPKSSAELAQEEKMRKFLQGEDQ